MKKELVIRHLGRVNYMITYKAMKRFTEHRAVSSRDEIWLVEHFPVFTLGRRGDTRHVLDAGNIPVLHVDRGGQVTYHGPGQLVAYLLLDLRRHSIGIRSLVDSIQNSIIACLTHFDIDSSSRANAPGVYVNNSKIASIGLRVRRGCCYHGLSLNVAMDLEPYKRINPCGYAGLEITQISDIQKSVDIDTVRVELLNHLPRHFGYEQIQISDKIIDNMHSFQIPRQESGMITVDGDL